MQDLLTAPAERLEALSLEHGWSLKPSELLAVQSHFKSLGRAPTRCEIETIAQTWSEHCKHKTFTSPILYEERSNGRPSASGGRRRITNLFQETVAHATRKLARPWCLSVFKDNAGVVAFRRDWALAFKVETHNHPVALAPYGGAATGVGGVIRDILGVGLGAKPVLNTDIFGFAPLHLDPPPQADGTHHPRRVLREVVAGVRDYGNRMGIPTASGALWFDPGYLHNPLVFCGTVGLMRRSDIPKKVKPGDLLVVLGGRTGADGLHGATFSSRALTEEAPSSAVQIGHAIVEKKALDALTQARAKRLYRAITDCGAGGFSSAIGEMGAELGAEVQLEKAPLKHRGLAPWQIWLSESQERMVLAVPPACLAPLKKILEAEDVEGTVVGEFTDSGRLVVRHGDEKLVDLEMDFLHHGLPREERRAVWKPPELRSHPSRKLDREAAREAVYRLLSNLNIASKEWVIRQYDHEVQGATALKPLVGPGADGPADACVVWPSPAMCAEDPSERPFSDFTGFAVSNGLNPQYGKLDPYWMACAAVEEALRNLVCVGADPERASLLDNFAWGNPEDPEVLGTLVRAALGARDAALGFGVPFISGKDSLYNEYADLSGKRRSIPGTLVISALAPVPDIRRAQSMDLKSPGHALYLVGMTRAELGGSQYLALRGTLGSNVPKVDFTASKKTLAALAAAVQKGLARACHDLSEGGLAVGLSEMAFAGDIGAEVELDKVSSSREARTEETLLFSESCGRFLVEVEPSREGEFRRTLRGSVLSPIGKTLSNPILRIKDLSGQVLLEEPLATLKEAWRNALPRALGEET